MDVDVTKINLKVVLGGCVAGVIAVLVSPTFLGLIAEPWRTLFIIFLGAAIPGGIAFNANSPKQVAMMKRIALLEDELARRKTTIITADAKPEAKP